MVVWMMITAYAAPGLSQACLGGRGGPEDLNSSSTLLESTSPDPIMLRPEGVRSALRLRQQDAARMSPGEVLRRAVASRRLMLMLCDLRAAQTPQTLFHVYLNLPEHADQATRASHLLAQFNFFEALRPGDRTTPLWQSIDVTRVVGALIGHGRLETEATLTILAAEAFDPTSNPSVGRIAIVQQ